MWRLSLLPAASAALLSTHTTDNPIKKVVTLLEEMSKNLEQEKKNDDQLFSKMECWCKTNRGEKTEATKQAQAKIEQLTGVINQNAGTIGSLSEQIKNLQKEVAKKQEDLKTAGSVRAKEKSSAEAEQREMTETIEALTKALGILGGVQNTGLTQTAATAFLQVVESNKNIHARFSGLMQKDLWDVLGAMDGAESKNFLQRDYSNPPTDPTGLKGNAAGVKSYNNRSGKR